MPSPVDGSSRISVEGVLGKDASTAKDAAVLMGGSTGSDIDDFQKQYPNLPDWVILQDLPEVCQHIRGPSDREEIMAHDFFTSQPIQDKI